MGPPPSRSVDRADVPWCFGITGGVHLAGVVIQVDHHGVADRAGDRFHLMASPLELGSGFPADSFLQAEFARRDHRGGAVRGGVERIFQVAGAEAVGGDGGCGHHAEFDVVQQHVQRRLVLQVAAGNASIFLGSPCGFPTPVVQLRSGLIGFGKVSQTFRTASAPPNAPIRIVHTPATRAAAAGGPTSGKLAV